MLREVPFAELQASDLVVDAVYEGGASGNSSDDPIARLLPGAGNQGGFRAAGRGSAKTFVVLYTSGEDGDWPDKLDPNTGQFIYFGDNKTPGHELHDTPRGGNVEGRAKVPPFFVFMKTPTARSGRAVQFKGLAVPGFPGLPMTEDLVAVWKSSKARRFQNYRAIFTILDVAVVNRAWLQRLQLGNGSEGAPPALLKWIETGRYTPLTAVPVRVIRSLQEQEPETPLQRALLARVWQHFNKTPIAFESFAARLYQMTDQRVIVDAVTRATADGGRDAIGRYLLGQAADPVYAEFALEAKCYRPSLSGETPNTVGVKEVSRLISRLRHRQFGVLVTTSAIARQAYEEVRDDGHPIVFICGRDIAEILIRAGYNSPDLVGELLDGWPATPT
jgi:Restriction endonuclease AspBHI N-terminal/Restriction endonuclease